jgi:pyruvate,water dikinase
MAAFLGMSQAALVENKPLFDNMVGEIYGALYYNVTAWQQLLYQLPFGKKTSRQITRIWSMEDAIFTPPASKPSLFNYGLLLFNLMAGLVLFKKHKKAFEAKYAAITSNYDKADFNKKTHAELVADFHHIDRELAENWTVPVLNGFFAMLLFSALKKLVLRSRLQAEHPNFANDVLFSQGDVISVTIVREFQNLLHSIQADEALAALFRQGTPTEIMEQLADLYPSVYQKTMRYIELYGERCEGGELKLETSNYKDDPLRFIALLQSNVQGAMPTGSSAWTFDYRAVLREKYRYNPLKRLALLGLVKVTLHRIRDRENYRFLRTKAFAMVRNLFRAIDQRLLEQGGIEAKGDSLYLDLQAILNQNFADGYKSMIAENKLRYEGYRSMERANRYAQDGSGFRPVEKDLSASAKSQWKGLGCCSGTVTAKVAIITGGAHDSSELAGRILVARYFEPGWINLFAHAAGIVSEKGNLLSHTAILCREMGIPSIVGAKGIFDVLKNGDTVQMNGTTGTINLLQND